MCLVPRAEITPGMRPRLGLGSKGGMLRYLDGLSGDGLSGEYQDVSIPPRSLVFQPFWLFSFSHRSDPRLSLFHETSRVTRMLYLWSLAPTSSLVQGCKTNFHWLLTAIIDLIFSPVAARRPDRWRRKTYHCVQDLYFPLGASHGGGPSAESGAWHRPAGLWGQT